MTADSVVLADCRTRSGLAVARSLGRHGVRVVTLAPDRKNLAAKSRHVARALGAPDPMGAPAAYAARVAEVARESGARLVIPITDAAISALNRRREVFDGVARLALSSGESVENVLAKRANIALAKRVGVPCPRDFDLRSRTQTREMIDRLGLPLVVKNADPDGLDAGRRLPFRVAIARDEAEVERILDTVEAARARPLYQEFVRGRSISVCTFAIEGEVVAMHAYVSQRRSLHEGIAREIVPLEPALAAHAARLVRALGWTGVTHMQFLVDEAGGRCGYMETNGRFWASTQGTVNAGWDVPRWFYEYFSRGITPEVPPIRIGCRTVHRRADLQQLYRWVVRGQVPPTGPAGRFFAVRQFLKDLSPSVCSDVWQWDDPMPAMYDLRELFPWLRDPPATGNRLAHGVGPDGAPLSPPDQGRNVTSDRK
jgi:predicted ATP-grasp superfamily ATP-dependent carboligase